jgi:hypothetical protein
MAEPCECLGWTVCGDDLSPRHREGCPDHPLRARIRELESALEGLGSELSTAQFRIRELGEELRGMQPVYCGKICWARPESSEDVSHTPRCDRARAVLSKGER